ncbi:MAG TPA: hypothetical protein PKW08_06900 [Flavobacteriaceae bacterium]|nr:hypothetical protein [Flavobacteriaceae bacterium]MCB9212802.1 hypothetical protein [Alteromonas sp.]HPF12253.1 hypothetical protein [Flavobacteriaceae bacterium]HQU21299.1 hypothetical protein [Flavobacteriaceae bacterium]HQU66227.1 hypothetical protein [Flavobacteriaceae bacterium]
MKTKLPQLLTYLFIAFTFMNVHAQVGINTTTPQGCSLLDVSGPDKGILIPRVDISNLGSIAPITGGSAESLLVYNTNTTTGKGFHYWNGSQWIAISSDDWKKGGNGGTIPGTGAGQHFLGTSDAQDFIIATNGTERCRVLSDGRIQATMNGTAANPLFSWIGDPDKGFYSAGANAFGIATNGIERFTSSDAEAVFNDPENAIDFRVATDGASNTLFVDGANNNVGLGTNSPNTSAQLELVDTDRGILINRLPLTSTALTAPISSPATGLLVYNTANASSGSTEVLPGFYYWEGSRWIAMGGTGGKDWSLEGNAGTSPGTNFLGTTDNVSLLFRTTDTDRMEIDADGTIGIGNSPYSDVALRVNNSAVPYGIISETSSNGVAVYASDSGTGLGIFGTSANNHGIYGTTAYTGGVYLIGGIIGWGTGSSRANGMLAVSDQPAGSDSNMGIRAVSGSTSSISSTQIMNVGVNTNATDLALYALSEGPITSLGEMEAARFQTNYTGSAINADARDPRAQLAGYTNNSLVGGNSMYYGAFLYSGGSSSNSSYAYAGARYGGTNYKIIGNGNVSTIVEGVDGKKKIMFASEAPEVFFEDYGVGTLMGGSAYIQIDPNFSNNIVVDQNHPLKVFIQLEGDCSGVYVTQKTAEGFLVKELQHGTSNVSFSYHIVANRKDELGNSPDESSKYADLRFPNAPDALQPKESKVDALEKNKPRDSYARMN